MIASIQGRLIRKSEEHVILEQGGNRLSARCRAERHRIFAARGGDRKALYIPSRT